MQDDLGWLMQFRAACPSLKACPQVPSEEPQAAFHRSRRQIPRVSLHCSQCCRPRHRHALECRETPDFRSACHWWPVPSSYHQKRNRSLLSVLIWTVHGPVRQRSRQNWASAPVPGLASCSQDFCPCYHRASWLRQVQLQRQGWRHLLREQELPAQQTSWELLLWVFQLEMCQALHTYRAIQNEELQPVPQVQLASDRRILLLWAPLWASLYRTDRDSHLVHLD